MHSVMVQPPPVASTAAIRLGAAAAASCRRRIHLDHDPDADRSAMLPPDPAGGLIRTEIAGHRAAVLRRVAIPGALLSQSLTASNRIATVDVLVPDGAGYVPILIKGHRTLDAGDGATVSLLTDPLAAVRSSTQRVRPHNEDALALAHCYRLLQELGMASANAVGGIIGRGNANDDVICWYDLASTVNGPSILQDYDTRITDRLEVATSAARRDLPLAWPSRVSECRRCPWNGVCTVELTLRRDVSLIAPGSDAASLRSVGVATVDDLAAADDAQLSAVAISRMTGVARGPELRDRARAWQQDAVLVRRNERVRVPRADIELDVDMECYIDDGAYLWGTQLSGNAAGLAAAAAAGFDPGYQPFVTWAPLPDPAEGAIFAEFWAYLRELQLVANEAGLTFAAYCYSRQAEERWLFSTPARYPDVPGMPSTAEVRAFTGSSSWVDMYEMVNREFLAAGSKRLKTVAPVAGFHWRDPEPDGANSMVWYRGAVGANGGPPSERLKTRLLQYNEDDVLATLALRQWMTDRAADDTPTVAQLAQRTRPAAASMPAAAVA
jgi:predicted RecB family nuclease